MIQEASELSKMQTSQTILVLVLTLLLASLFLTYRIPSGFTTTASPTATHPLSNPLPTTDWTQFHGNYTHNGYSDYPGPLKSGINWTYNLGGADDGLIADSGRHALIASSFTGRTFAISEQTGSQLFEFGTCSFFSFNCEGGTTYPPEGGGLLFTSGWVYNGGSEIFADYLSSGGIAWGNTNVVGYVGQSPYYGWWLLTYYQGYVLDAPFGSTVLDGFLSSSGALQWRDNLVWAVDTIPTAGNGVAVVGFSNHNMIAALSPLTGSALWNFTTDAHVDASPAFASGNFYIGTLGGTVYKVSSSGTKTWSSSIGAAIESTPTAANGLVYFGADDGYIYALHASDGSVAWKYLAGGTLISSPALSGNGILYEGDSNDYIYAIASNNGSLVWSRNLGSSIISSPVLDNGFLYVVNGTGFVNAFGYDSAPVTLPPPPIPPTPPTGLMATPGSNRISLVWSPPTSNGGAAISGYKIYRSTSSGTETYLASPGNVTSYADNSVSAGTTYYYKVTATNSAGESSFSNEVSAARATGAPSLTAASITLIAVIAIVIKRAVGLQTPKPPN